MSRMLRAVTVVVMAGFGAVATAPAAVGADAPAYQSAVGQYTATLHGQLSGQYSLVINADHTFSAFGGSITGQWHQDPPGTLVFTNSAGAMGRIWKSAAGLGDRQHQGTIKINGQLFERWYAVRVSTG